MESKKRVTQANAPPALIKFRAKRKWQIALRRYVIEKSPSAAYAPFFGIDILNFRRWVGLQFDSTLNWENFGPAWQFDHILPVNFFDFEVENDMKLCWNFINIRVEKSQPDKTRPDVLAAKRYFETLYAETRLPVAKELVNKITKIETSEIASTDLQRSYIKENLQYLMVIADFTEYEFDKLNHGIAVKEILLERELTEKYK